MADGTSVSLQSPRRGSVLIVDDEDDIIDALREIIEPIAEHIDFASSGVEALELVQGHRYDLLLSDLRMPDLDGPGLYKALQKKPGFAPRHTIFITGAALDEEVMDFIKTSGAEVLEKPFSPAAVRHVVQRVLSDS